MDVEEFCSTLHGKKPPNKPSKRMKLFKLALNKSLDDARARIARITKNPRLLRISFHTFRHWKATTLYHKTQDILYVKEFLGHKRLDSKLVYINIEKALFYNGKLEDFHVKIAQTPEEIKGLLEVGYP